jgi:histidinol-phosphate aminotransferase
VSQPLNIQALKIAKTPYSVSTLSLQLGIEVLKKQPQVFQNIQEIIQTRQYVYESLKKHVEDIQPSYGNFVYVYESRVNLYEKLLEKKIKIRSYNNNFYRISIGTPKEMERCIQRIKEIL